MTARRKIGSESDENSVSWLFKPICEEEEEADWKKEEEVKNVGRGMTGVVAWGV
ncbi:hypothetical protein Hanom_Chr09g00837571 [Helianthus anomalus]